MPELPRITIVTPSFDQGRFLEKTIQSILSQQYENLEYLVIDGGSTDGSVDIIRRYQDRLHYWVSEPDSGQADAIAKGFARSTGEIMGWLNSDDLLLPGALATVAQTFSRSRDIQMTYGNIVVINEWNHMQHVCIQTPARFETLFYGGQIINQEAVFWTRNLYNRVGGLNRQLQYALDYDLWVRMSRVTMPHYIPVILAAFRQHPAQKSHRIDRYIDEMRLVQRQLRTNLGESAASFAVKSLWWRTRIGLRRTSLMLKRWYRTPQNNTRFLWNSVVSISDQVHDVVNYLGTAWLYGYYQDGWLGPCAALAMTAHETTRRMRIQYVVHESSLVTSLRIRVGRVLDSRWQVMTDIVLPLQPMSGSLDIEISASTGPFILVHFQLDRSILLHIDMLRSLLIGDPRPRSIRLIHFTLATAGDTPAVLATGGPAECHASSTTADVSEMG